MRFNIYALPSGVVALKFLRLVLLSASVCFLIQGISACTAVKKNPGYLYFRLNQNPTTLDPALIIDVQGGALASKIFNGLVRLDDKLHVVPDIAERWEIRDLGKTYVFFLKPGVRFSNHREVTADDFLFSFLRILNPKYKSPNTWVFEKILGAKEYSQGISSKVSGIEIIGKYTLKISLKEPFSPFLSLLAMTAAYVVPREEVERWGVDFSSHPVGTGPFILKQWRHDSDLVLIRNCDYFQKKAKISGIVYRIIPEDLTAVAEFELGNIDIISVPASELSRYRNSAQWGSLLSSVPGLNTYYLGFNCSRPPFDNVTLRKAVSYSIDKEKILSRFYEGRGRLALGPVPDLLRDWAISVEAQYNPEKARRIIRQEGMEAKTVKFYSTTDREAVDMAEIIQSYMRKSGLDVRIIQLEWSAYKEAINSGEADIFWISWWADYPDPENFLFPLLHSSNHGVGGNRTRFTNKEVDRLIEKGQQAVNLIDRNNSYMAVEQIISEEVPLVFFCHKSDYALRQPYVSNFKMYPIYHMDKGTEVSF